MSKREREKARPDVSWMSEAACKDPESRQYFYPSAPKDLDYTSESQRRKLSRSTAAANRLAKRLYCDVCPVWGDCVLYAIDFEPDGFWAGLGERTRRNLKNGRKSIIDSLDVYEIRRRSVK